MAFTGSEQAAALNELEGYTAGYEAARVRLAILIFAHGKLSEVKRLVAVANNDYRNLLYWAEYPEESGGGTKAQMAERYRKLGIPVPVDLL
jgi:hypothetical protein